MSKPNTKHIIGFAVKTHQINLPSVVTEETENYAVKGYVKDEYWIKKY